MSKLQKTAAAVLIALLAAAAYGLWATHAPPVTSVQHLRKSASVPAAAESAMPVIDENTLITAQRLARLANTPDEQSLAQSAVQTADHELDLAFTAALWHLEAHPPPLSAEASQIQERLSDAQKTLTSEAESVKQLTRELAQAADPDKAAIQDRLDLAQSRLELAQDEVHEANDDLLQAGGNVHQRIQQMQQEHQAAEHIDTRTVSPAAGALGSLRGMVGAIREWLALRGKQRSLTEAQQQVATSAAQLAAERQQLAADLAVSKASVPELASRAQHRTAAAAPAAATRSAGAGAASGTAATRPRAANSASAPANAAPAAPAAASAPVAPDTSAVASSATGSTPTLLGVTRQIAAEQRRLTLRDQRIAARRRLADIYGQWVALVASQARAVLHGALQSAAIVLAALLLLLFADRWLEQLVGRARIDRRQLATLRSVVGVALQIVAVAVILLMLVGLPGQIGAMLGLVGAGLTVALKVFIVAFIGWFVLMGRNGMRLGDWVEINGVSGEVVELNMFHTVLLETGNWTDAGHPTGRRVTFTNSFAIGGHYFNFSTSGQWLWDELSVVVPYDRDPHAIADAIQREVTAATAKDASQAEEEWRRASRGQRGVGFTAQPGIAVRPASGGVEVAVRYVTRASERLALRARLYQSAVRLLAAPAVHAARA